MNTWKVPGTAPAPSECEVSVAMKAFLPGGTLVLDDPTTSLPHGSHLALISLSYDYEEDSSPEDSLLSHFPAVNPTGASPSSIRAVTAEEKQRTPDQRWVQRCRNEAQHLSFALVSPKVSSSCQNTTAEITGNKTPPGSSTLASRGSGPAPSVSLHCLEGVSPYILTRRE